MPSTKDPSTLVSGAGKLHASIANAATELFLSSSSSDVVASISGLANQPLAAPTAAGPYTSVGGGDASKVLIVGIGPFYVGDDVSDSISDLFKVVLASDDTEIFDPTLGVTVLITSITGATIGAGFTSSAVTVNFSTPIPSGVVYKVYYGKKVTLGGVPPELASFPAIRRAPQVERTVELLLRALKDDAPGAVISWSDAWIASIGSLARSGLDARYRRATSVVTGNLNTPGDGAVITRDGIAVTVKAPAINVSGAENNPDPLMAQFAASVVGAQDSTTDITLGGHVGLAIETNRRNTANSTEKAKPAEHAAGLMTYIPRDVRSDTLNVSPFGAQSVLTRIDVTKTCILNPDNGGGANAQRTLELNVTDFFINASGATAIKVGIDLLMVTFLSGHKRAYIIEQIDVDTNNVRRAYLKTLSGDNPAFLSPTNVTVQWLQVTAGIGGTANSTNLYDGHFLATAGKLTDGLEGAGDLSSRVLVGATDDPQDTDLPVIHWGGIRRRRHTGIGASVGNVGYNGFLAGDGGLNSGGGVVAGFFQSRHQTFTISAAGPTTYTWGPTNPISHASTFYINAPAVTFNVTSVANPTTITLNLDTSLYTPAPGQQLYCTIVNVNGVVIVGNWPSQFLFANSDNLITGGIPGAILMYRFTHMGSAVGNKFLAERILYLP